MTNLVTAIEMAQESNERKLSADIEAPKQEIDSEGLLLLRHFAAFTKQRGVRFCPCKPATVAAFIRSEAALGVPPERILATLAAITAVHNQAAEANPVACAMPQAELGRILEIKPPRSWSKKLGEDLIFNTLPVDVQYIVKRHADLSSLELRHLQNRVADISKPKETKSDNGSTQELR
jgi:hypothetical protein